MFSTPWLQEMLGQECPEYYTKWHSGFLHWKTHKFNSTAVLIQFSIAATCNKCFQLQQFSYIIEFPLFRLTVKHRQKATVCPGQKAKSQSGCPCQKTGRRFEQILHSWMVAILDNTSLCLYVLMQPGVSVCCLQSFTNLFSTAHL